MFLHFNHTQNDSEDRRKTEAAKRQFIDRSLSHLWVGRLRQEMEETFKLHWETVSCKRPFPRIYYFAQIIPTVDEDQHHQSPRDSSVNGRMQNVVAVGQRIYRKNAN